MVMITLYAKQKKRHKCIEQTFVLWEKARVGCFKRTASKHVYYLGWSRLPSQVGCMRQVLGPGALGRPRGIGWRGRCEGGLGWGIHVKPCLILANVWQKPLQYCKVISLQLRKKKCCTQYTSKFGKHRSGHRAGKRSTFILIPKKDNAKESSNTAHLHLSHRLGK